LNIIFSHANGYVAPVYGVLFAHLRARGLQVAAIEKYGHDPLYPVSDNWPHLVQQLVDFAAQEKTRRGEAAWLVGHSLGGYLSLMAACVAPQLVKGVVLLDSPVLGGWRAGMVRVSKRTGIVESFSPGKLSRKRRQHWPSVEAALAHFKSKKVFAQWHPQVLEDYANYGTQEALVNGRTERVLSFDRSVETAIYNTLPDQLAPAIKKAQIPCPVAFIGGTGSGEIRQVGMALTERVTQGRIMMLDGGHLFPMEKPLVTAAAIEAALLNLSTLTTA
jgi:pimeloyl-ACP methyl ester carboxylesterase